METPLEELELDLLMLLKAEEERKKEHKLGHGIPGKDIKKVGLPFLPL
jgi:hypothetical protein